MKRDERLRESGEKEGDFISDKSEREGGKQRWFPGRPPVIVACSPCVATRERAGSTEREMSNLRG